MASGYGLQYDAQGRPYFEQPGQAKNYVSPVAFGKPLSTEGGGLIHARTQWNQETGQEETPIDLGKVLSIGTGAALAAPLIVPALSGLGGAGGAAGGTSAAAGGGSAAATGAGTAAGAGGSVGFLSSAVKYAPEVMGLISDLGKVSSGASTGRAAGRASEAGLMNDNERLKLDAARILENALQSRGNLELDQRKYALDAPGKRAGNAVRGDTLANVQDASISGLPSRINVPNISGGVRPSLLSGDTRALGKQMSRDALLGQMQGDQFTPPPAMNIPKISDVPQSSGLDTALNTGGNISAIIQALQPYTQRQIDIPTIPGSQPPAGGTGLPTGNPSIPSFAGWDPNATKWWEDQQKAGG